ncbi:response regulator [Saccharophagus degradans]|uniref:Response regulator n=1 Tax=Saccharophagus degradans TaxID=86304 RepID=A0AAW7X777_9GAMM|nr:response regulator [Saccharophagus degradans]MDO6422486.1 response regulator [Saccharophagus degradans]MDO6606967.1 response regulator [Saccharophagus degradans]WGO99815.1 response regulator [Saccharophagus degradans]
MTDSIAPRVLIVEDEPDLAQLLNEYMQAAQYSTTVINNGTDANDWLQANEVDIVLLDLMLPGMSGLDICRNIRKASDVPVIMITAKVEEIDRLIGLELGADDYICKPYSPREVVARTKAVLRRTLSDTPSSEEQSQSVVLCEEHSSVIVHKQEIELTQIEYRMFKLLFEQPGRIFSRQFIMDNIYTDYRVVSDRTVDSHIKKLRKKLQAAAPEQDIIRSVYGAGYKFENL